MNALFRYLAECVRKWFGARETGAELRADQGSRVEQTGFSAMMPRDYWPR